MSEEAIDDKAAKPTRAELLEEEGEIAAEYLEELMDIADIDGDIDIDVESARRTEMYERIMERFGGERVTCVSMMETYRVRHAIRDVGSALGLPPVAGD